MKQLLTDIQGIIQELNLSVTDVLYPFYETVVNSIQAVSEIYENHSNAILS